MSVCSDRLMRTRRWPQAAARADTWGTHERKASSMPQRRDAAEEGRWVARWDEARRARTSDVLPTPGEPSSSRGFEICMARSRRIALRPAEGASSEKVASAPPATQEGPCERRQGKTRRMTDCVSAGHQQKGRDQKRRDRSRWGGGWGSAKAEVSQQRLFRI